MHDDATMLHHPDALTRLRYVVHRLRAPGGCPWDMEQTHETLIPHVIEEAYEVAEAIRGGDPAQICDELGDILLQPVLHAEIASESGTFDLDKMAHGLCEKLIRRHPHVFGETTAETSAAVLNQWDAIKRQEKGTQHEGMLHGVGGGLPALMRGQKLQKKAARVGFDWPDAAPVFGKIAAAVTDIGGMMSHAAIVCREYGLPAVTGTGTASAKIKTGMRLLVDGNTGSVTILD